MRDPKVCSQCGKRFMTSKYRREHERSPFAHLSSDKYTAFTTGNFRKVK